MKKGQSKFVRHLDKNGIITYDYDAGGGVTYRIKQQYLKDTDIKAYRIYIGGFRVGRAHADLASAKSEVIKMANK